VADRYILVLDAGTSAMRCHLFDASGTSVAQESYPWLFAHESDAPELARHFDAPAIWEAACGLMRSVLTAARAHPRRVAAVAVTSQRQGVAFLDAQGAEVYIGPNIDLRAVFEGAALDQDHRDEVYTTTGHLPSFFFAPAKLRWFQVHRADDYARIASVLSLADWLTLKLTGLRASELTLAGEAGLLDIGTRSWAVGLMAKLGLVMDGKLPLLPSGSVAGGVSALASRETGIAAGTPVTVAGADTQTGLLGLGVLRPGEAGIVAGWSSPIQMTTTQPVFSADGATWAGCHLPPDRWVLESSAGDTGAAYAWLVHTLWHEPDEAFQAADAASGAISPGSDGALAVFGPPRMDMRNVGLLTGGVLFPAPVTFHEKSRGHLTRAALEAAAYTIRGNIEQAERLAGVRAARVALGGGMTKTHTFVRVLADVLGRQVEAATQPAVSALGAYLCAATALGEFASLEEAAAAARKALRPVQPDLATATEYEEHYQRWLETAEKLRGIAL
jgi:sugar (pentulose or hexulose) kinase